MDMEDKVKMSREEYKRTAQISAMFGEEANLTISEIINNFSDNSSVDEEEVSNIVENLEELDVIIESQTFTENKSWTLDRRD